ncbi:MAG TPA: phenylalanine--tRNA ligase subunit alpha [Acidobacteriaceae bacterium]|jgi:phenylalanyl-tRNA synthetase alpha chain|nr:phenylalanine--tRNA ligase subunit alpha [Acidobacteriaceae bacterium]
MQENEISSGIPSLTGWSDAELDQAFAAVAREVEESAATIRSAEDTEQFRLTWFGRKQGRLKLIGDAWLKAAPGEAKRQIGQRFNTLKAEIEQRLERAGAGSAASELDAEALDAEKLDITLPGTRRKLGAEHPLIKTWNEIVSVFQRMGYSVGVGPEVETDYYNFESLNFPPGHPARDTQDTLVIVGQERKPLRDRLLMRTHTSPVQIRTMEQQPPPVRIIIPGKVHRNDAADATHYPIFHQVEGLCVDTNITFGDLKGTLDAAMKAFFGSSVKTRFFPSFFPFTEPSADVQISCPFCGGSGCRKCKHSGWIELLGCGMVDPVVFGFVQGKQPGYDPKKVSGFAFGMGIDRIAMMKYGIGDIGLLYSGDLRFLEQFA